jgi:cytochrome c oxidase subunit 3
MDHIISFPVTTRPAPLISNGRLGMMLLVGTETLLFSSFIGAYLVLRMSAGLWPPMGTPLLTLGLSSINTVLLIASSVVAQFRRWRMAFWMGTLFVGLQGVEFFRLYTQGLTLQSGTYGALFYSLISCHALHVLGGLVILALAQTKAGEWAGHAQLYWHFVTAVWIVLFSILYIL